MSSKNPIYKAMTTWRWLIFLLFAFLFIAIPFLNIEVLPSSLGLRHEKSIEILYYSFIIILNFLLVTVTFMLVYVAWVQLSGLRKTARADFLLRIDERYGSEPIIKARSIIQRLYRESNNLHPNAHNESIHRSHIAKRIDEISRDANSFEEYTYLLNLLDFLETISYYANNSKIISSKDIKNLMGPSMEFFFKIFLLRIHDRRQKYHNRKYYCEFHQLVKKLRKENR